MSKKVEIDKALPLIIEFQTGLLIFVNLIKITEIKIVAKTIVNCATSIPRLKENNGNNIFSSLPKIDLSKYEKPIP